jgi:hypothetical protein
MPGKTVGRIRSVYRVGGTSSICGELLAWRGVAWRGVTLVMDGVAEDVRAREAGYRYWYV